MLVTGAWGDQPRATRKLNFPTISGGVIIAGQALPTGQSVVMTSQTSPRKVPAHQWADRLGESTTRTIKPAFVGGASVTALDWQPACPGAPAVTR